MRRARSTGPGRRPYHRSRSRFWGHTAPAKAAATAAPTPTPLPTVMAPAGGIKIIWWRSLTGKNGSTLDAMAKRFNELQNKIAVQVEFQGAYGELRDKLVAATAAVAVRCQMW